MANLVWMANFDGKFWMLNFKKQNFDLKFRYLAADI